MRRLPLDVPKQLDLDNGGAANGWCLSGRETCLAAVSLHHATAGGYRQQGLSIMSVRRHGRSWISTGDREDEHGIHSAIAECAAAWQSAPHIITTTTIQLLDFPPNFEHTATGDYECRRPPTRFRLPEVALRQAAAPVPSLLAG